MSEGRDMGITGVPKMGICRKCKKRQATIYWTDGVLSFAHGAYTEYCKICAVTEQLEHAKERASKVPELEAELKNLLDKENVK